MGAARLEARACLQHRDARLSCARHAANTLWTSRAEEQTWGSWRIRLLAS